MPRLALVHDYFTQQGGAERVAEELYLTLNRPDVFTTALLPQHIPPGLQNANIRTSWMQRLPRMKQLHRLYFPLYPIGVAGLDLSAYDVVVSSSSSYAKGVHRSRNALHICYCHTPTRWIWRYREYAEREKFNRATRIALPILLRALRKWDEQAARQPDQFVANSKIVADRIESAYNRKAVVIPPPIDVNRFSISPVQEDFYVVLSRLVSYKRIELAIQACGRLNRRLVIIGDGVDRKRLQSIAGKNVTFLGRISDPEVSHYAGRCRALIFPGEEDFGMAPLELAAAGRPTIAFARGGATETIIDGVTGCFFEEQEPNCVAEAILRSEDLTWNAAALRRHAATFDVGVFRTRILDLLRRCGVSLDSVEADPCQAACEMDPVQSAPAITAT